MVWVLCLIYLNAYATGSFAASRRGNCHWPRAVREQDAKSLMAAVAAREVKTPHQQAIVLPTDTDLGSFQFDLVPEVVHHLRHEEAAASELFTQAILLNIVTTFKYDRQSKRSDQPISKGDENLEWIVYENHGADLAKRHVVKTAKAKRARLNAAASRLESVRCKILRKGGLVSVVTKPAKNELRIYPDRTTLGWYISRAAKTAEGNLFFQDSQGTLYSWRLTGRPVPTNTSEQKASVRKMLREGTPLDILPPPSLVVEDLREEEEEIGKEVVQRMEGLSRSRAARRKFRFRSLDEAKDRLLRQREHILAAVRSETELRDLYFLEHRRPVSFENARIIAVDPVVWVARYRGGAVFAQTNGGIFLVWDNTAKTPVVAHPGSLPHGAAIDVFQKKRN
jgi:hypothetical protein